MDKKYIEELLDKIKEHNNAYRAGIPVVSDKVYDQEVAELRRLDPYNEWFQQIEPGYVGQGRKVKLPIPMKSLCKAKSQTELQTWLKHTTLTSEDLVVVMPKFDGLSLLHNEKNGMTYSRGGSDNEGQNCTAHYNAANIPSIETKLEYTFGEFVFNCMSWEHNFQGKVSEETGEKYKSPRNTAAGLLNRDIPSEKLQHIDFFRYGTDDTSLQQFDTYSNLISYLCRKFDQQCLYKTVQVSELSEEWLQQMYETWSAEYYIDGLVIYVNDLSLWNQLGRQATTGNPNYAIAYKSPNFTEVFETTVREVLWKINKSGAFKPVVNIDTVDTGDCEMENPTGYNAKYIYENMIGPGAIVKVTRSGGVIPKILEVVKPAPREIRERMWEDLCSCPICGCITVWNDTKTELCCNSLACSGRRLAKIIHFYTALGVENMGEETISKIFHEGFDTLRKILDITFEELLAIDGFGESIANTILNNNSLIRDGVEISYLMHASDCFAGIGQIKATKLLQDMSETERNMFITGYLHPEDVNVMCMRAQYKKVNKTTLSFLQGIKPFYKFVAENELTILPPKNAATVTGNKYTGMKVCFTGVRDANLEQEIVENGGEVCSGVSKKTTHLIVANKDSASGKATKATQLGIPIMTIEEFKAL